MYVDELLTIPQAKLSRLPLEATDEMPPKPGIYFAVPYVYLIHSYLPYAQVRHLKKGVAYIGQCDDFRDRWRNHHRRPDLELMERHGWFIDLLWIELPGSTEEERKYIERQLINQLETWLNDKRIRLTECERRAKRALWSIYDRDELYIPNDQGMQQLYQRIIKQPPYYVEFFNLVDTLMCRIDDGIPRKHGISRRDGISLEELSQEFAKCGSGFSHYNLIRHLLYLQKLGLGLLTPVGNPYTARFFLTRDQHTQALRDWDWW